MKAEEYGKIGRKIKNLTNDLCVLVSCPSLQAQEVPVGPSCCVFTAPSWTLEGSAAGRSLPYRWREWGKAALWLIEGEIQELLRPHPPTLWLINFPEPAGPAPSLERAIIPALFRPQSPCYQESWGLIATLIKRLFKNLWLTMKRTWRVICNKEIRRLLETQLLMSIKKRSQLLILLHFPFKSIPLLLWGSHLLLWERLTTRGCAFPLRHQKAQPAQGSTSADD